MKKLVDMPPVLVLLSLLVGAKLFGFLGTIFAVPVFGIIYEFIKEFLEKEEVSMIVCRRICALLAKRQANK